MGNSLLIFYLTLAVLITGFFLYPFLTTEETQFEFIDTDRGLLVVGSAWDKTLLFPSQGFPVFLSLGEKLEVWILYRSNVSDCKLWLDNVHVSVLEITKSGRDLWRLRAQIPPKLEEGVYDLKVEVKGENLGEGKGRNSVVVGKLRSIAVISDTHIDVENWKIVPFRINPKPIPPERMGKNPLLSKLLTDLNRGLERIKDGVFVCEEINSKRLRSTLSYLRENVKPDLVFITGDLVDWSGWKNWKELSDILAESELPCCAVPGNHDWRPRTQLLTNRKFLEPFYLYLNSFDVFVLKSDGVRLVGVNSGGDYEPYAKKGAGLTLRQVEWIRRYLNENKPTVLFLHHPSTQETFGVRNYGETLFSIPNLKLVVAGHTHPPRPTKEYIRGVEQVMVPSVRDQEDPTHVLFLLDLHKLDG